MPVMWAAAINAGATIYAADQNERTANNATKGNDALADRQFEEDKRRYDLNREDQERWGMMQIQGEEEFDRRNRADKEQSYQRGYSLNRGAIDRGETAGNQLSYRMGLGGTGTGIAGGLNDRYKDFSFNFEADPGYQFQREEGLRGIGNQFAGSGNLLSGSALKAMERFGNGLADQSYSTTYNRARSGYESDKNDFNASNANEYNRLAGIQGSGQNAVNSTNGLGGTVQGSAGSGASGIASGLAHASDVFGQSSNNYFNNLMGNNNANANRQAAYNNAFGNAIGGGLGSIKSNWNSNNSISNWGGWNWKPVEDGGYSDGIGSAYGGNRAGL